MKFFNTLGRCVQDFEPINPANVGMYTCGPTVYNFAHIGNFRAYLFEDVLKRTLEYHGFKVTQVMNLTDVDDKTIRDSRAKNVPLREFTAVYKKAFFEDLDKLRIERAAVYPEATTHIPEMIHPLSIRVWIISSMPPISSVALGFLVAGLIFIPSMSFLHSAM